MDKKSNKNQQKPNKNKQKKSNKKKKVSNGSLPPEIHALRLPPTSYLISRTHREDKRKRNGGCKPKDTAWSNFDVFLINPDLPPKNDNISFCKCKFCQYVIKRGKYPIKVSTLRNHGIHCSKTPQTRKNLIRESIQKLKVKNALWTLQKNKHHHSAPSRVVYAHPAEVLDPVVYARAVYEIDMKTNEILENNNINIENNINDCYNINISNNSGRICIGNVSVSNNIAQDNDTHINKLVKQSAETTNTLKAIKNELNNLFGSYDELKNDTDVAMINNEQQTPSLTPTLQISTPPPPIEIPYASIKLEILPPLEERFPNAFPQTREIDGHSTMTFRPIKEDTVSSLYKKISYRENLQHLVTDLQHLVTG